MARGRRLKVLSELLFRLSPSAGLRVAEVRGLQFYNRSKRRPIKEIPTPAEFAALFGPRSAAELDVLARRHALAQYRNILIQSIAAGGGLRRVIPLVRWKSRERLEELKRDRRPAIITTWHAGPTIGIWAGIMDLNVELIRVQTTDWMAAPPGWEILIKREEPGSGGPLIKRCLKALRSGRWAVLPFDTFTTEPGHVLVKCLDRWIPVPRGVAALSEMTGAPIIPVAARWTEGGRAIEIEVQPDLDVRREAGEAVADYEIRAVQAAADRMDAYLRAHPEEINAKRMRYMIASPPSDSSVASRVGAD